MDTKEKNPGPDIPKQRPGEPLGDRGSEKTWEPPQGEQGISNRPDDEGTEEANDRTNP